MIEKGSYSYTNSETGQTTNINFGDYARKDERTGKYVIDQRLLNEARFTDEIKDLLEEQVSTYNKYSDEYLKTQDNIRKAEKELQEERKAALKNYTAMETEIAQALKAQYQEEVDALKDKYDSMKDADDDYLDAL
jgi:flagellar motility protein MotE (MotC chaperone)